MGIGCHMNCSEGPDKAPPIVTYLTRVKISLVPDKDILAEQAAGKELVSPELVRQAGSGIADHYMRSAAMMELLAKHGFIFRVRKDAVYCYSNDVEAGEVKRLLLSAGFRDKEFQIHLEYTRGWGML
jgi:hypothetical protein